MDWHKQQQDLAIILLNNLFPVYEEWLKVVQEEVNIKWKKEELQYPQRAKKEIENCIPNKSKVMHESFFATYCKLHNRSVDHIDNYLYCYRVFKEARNCYIHRGGIADGRLVQAYRDYQQGKHNTCQALDVKEVPEFMEPIDGKQVNISLRGIVGFSYIIIKLILSLETVLIEAPEAENFFIKKCKSQKILAPTLSGDEKKSQMQIKRFIAKCGFEKPNCVDVLKTLLLREKLVSI